MLEYTIRDGPQIQRSAGILITLKQNLNCAGKDDLVKGRMESPGMH